jgi:hypothetical protein
MFSNLYIYVHELCTWVMVGGCTGGGAHPLHQHLANTHRGAHPVPSVQAKMAFALL